MAENEVAGVAKHPANFIGTVIVVYVQPAIQVLVGVKPTDIAGILISNLFVLLNGEAVSSAASVFTLTDFTPSTKSAFYSVILLKLDDWFRFATDNACL